MYYVTFHYEEEKKKLSNAYLRVFL